MNNNPVQFVKPIRLYEPLVINFTDKANSGIIAAGHNVRDVLLKLSSLNRVLMTKTRNKSGEAEEKYEIFTDYGVFVLKAKPNATNYGMAYYNEKSLPAQNKAIKYGKIIDCSKGIMILYHKKDCSQYYEGNLWDISHNEGNGYTCVKSMRILSSVFEKVSASYEQEEEIYTGPSNSARRVLDLATQYAEIELEIQNKERQEAGQVHYYEILPALYDRQYRIPYIFKTYEFDRKKFKKGTQVQVGVDPDEMLMAEIIDMEDSNDELKSTPHLILLFNKVVSVEEIPRDGYIEQTESTVIKDVQTGAIKKIMEGEAKAGYIDRLFSSPKDMGFERKDLTRLKERLSKEKYPPNESQMEAIQGGIHSKDAYFVMGPPGTGKTTVILEWVKYFALEENKRVLISSQNNKAVDNVLERLRGIEGIDLIRIGSEAKLQSEVVPYILQNKIRSLQKQIQTATMDSIREITETLEQETAYKDNLEEVLLAYEKQVSEGESLLKMLEKEFLPQYEKSYHLMNNIQLMKKKSNDLLDQYTFISEKRRMQLLKENQDFFMKSMLFFQDQVLKYYRYRYNKSTSKLKEEISAYNEARFYLQELEHRAVEVHGKAYYEEILSFETVKRTLECSGKQESNSFGLFSKIIFDEMRMKERDYLREIREIYMNEKERADEIRNILIGWEEENRENTNHALQQMVLQSVNVVGATCIGVSSQKKFQNLDFDVTIIDEAGQIQIHNALVPMSVSQKLIMLGDHKQIPPSVNEEVANSCNGYDVTTEYLEKSLFEILYDHVPEENKKMLDTQYRMPAEIADLISKEFYDGDYKSPSFKKGGGGVFKDLADSPFILIDTSLERNRFDEKIDSEGYKNEEEARIIKEILMYMKLKNLVEPKEIGIISAYKSQVQEIKKKLTKVYKEDVIKEMVATLDSFQGQERDVIIYSFTRSSMKGRTSSRIGFLKELRRLNVAMTRAKKTLILIGDMEYLSTCEKVELDENGEQIYESSEKKFGQFIKSMLQHVDEGNGLRISSGDFYTMVQSEVLL